METVSLVVTILVAAVGATWVVSTQLSKIQIALASLVERVRQHEADIIDLKKARTRRR